MVRRITVILILVLMAGTAWAGPASEAQEEREELSLLMQVYGTISFDDNPVVQLAEELSGYELNIEAPPANNYWDRMRLVMASAQIPDIHANGVGDDFEKFASEGLIADIEDMISDYPNLMANITPAQWEDGRSATTGRIMAMPRPNATDYWGFLIRADWLEEVGMDVPTTLEEFAEVCEAFTTMDPDGNGRDDTYGYSFTRGLYHLNTEFIKTAFGLSIHDGFPDPNGEYTLRWNNPGYVPYLDYLKGLYEAGTLDPEWFTSAEGADEEKFLQNRIGIRYISQKGLYSFFDEHPELDHDNYVFGAPLASPYDGVQRLAAPPSNWMAYLIAADGNVEGSLDFLDWSNSEEGFKLFQIGIEGQHYTSYNLGTRQIVRNDAQVAESALHLAPGFFFANAYRGVPAIEGGIEPETQAKFLEEWGAVQAVSDIVEMPFVKVPEYRAIRMELPDDWDRMENLEQQYVLGQVSKSAFLAAVEDFTSQPLVETAQTAYAAYMAANEVDQ